MRRKYRMFGVPRAVANENFPFLDYSSINLRCMFNTLGCLFALVIGFVVFFAIAFGRILGFILSLFGIGFNNDTDRYNAGTQQQGFRQNANQQRSTSQQASQRSSGNMHTGRQQEKIFAKDESEYVDFEDVK